jgi:hypothetical protein
VGPNHRRPELNSSIRLEPADEAFCVQKLRDSFWRAEDVMNRCERVVIFSCCRGVCEILSMNFRVTM